MIGIDITDVKRFKAKNLAKSPTFLEKNFTEGEISYCESHQNRAEEFAGMFAAKEAVRKAFGNKKILIADIQIWHEKSGMPRIKILGKKVPHVKISISHTAEYAVAVCVVM